MTGEILAAGLDARELRLEVRFLQRDPGLLREADSARDVLEELARHPARLVVLGTRLSDLGLVETVERVRSGPTSAKVSILAVVPALLLIVAWVLLVWVV